MFCFGELWGDLIDNLVCSCQIVNFIQTWCNIIGGCHLLMVKKLQRGTWMMFISSRASKLLEMSNGWVIIHPLCACTLLTLSNTWFVLEHQISPSTQNLWNFVHNRCWVHLWWIWCQLWITISNFWLSGLIYQYGLEFYNHLIQSQHNLHWLYIGHI